MSPSNIPKSVTSEVREADSLGRQESLGLGLAPGDPHYRAFVGPPEDYDLVGAMTFSLLVSLGVQQQHKVLDIGCGSLRIGRLLIPYLNTGGYTGVEPNRWLVDEGIESEVGDSQVQLKQPHFVFDSRARGHFDSPHFDWAVAQSIFSHCGRDLLLGWLEDVSLCLSSDGALVATFIEADEDFEGGGWVYPHCVGYRFPSIQTMAEEVGLSVRRLDWEHPRQQWVLFEKGEKRTWLDEGVLGWNLALTKGPWGRSG